MSDKPALVEFIVTNVRAICKSGRLGSIEEGLLRAALKELGGIEGEAQQKCGASHGGYSCDLASGHEGYHVCEVTWTRG